MGLRNRGAATVAALAFAVAGCGSSGGGGSALKAADVAAAVSKASGVKLTTTAIPPQAASSGVDAYYVGTGGGQVVSVFVLKSAGKVNELKKTIAATGTVPGMHVTITKNVIVLYAATPGGGTDKSGDVANAINGL